MLVAAATPPAPVALRGAERDSPAAAARARGAVDSLSAPWPSTSRRRSSTSTRRPHLGHAYTTIAADVMARHMRQRGEDVFFLTGTDEHGEPVALAAEREGVSPKELADRNAERFKALMPVLDASNDFFIRTSRPRARARRCRRSSSASTTTGYVYKDLYEGWYCPRCADFKSESEMGPDNTCPIHGIALTREEEENYFFRLSTFQEPLEELLAADFVQPQRARTRRGRSSPRASRTSASRAGRSPGASRVPWDEGHVFYVWFDALLNYYTALGIARRGDDLTSRSGARRRTTSSARTSSSSTRSTGRRCSWPPGSSCRAASSSTASCSATTGARCRSPTATSSTRSRSSTASAPTRCATTSCATSASARTAASRWRASSSATRASSPTTSATSRAGRSRWSTATATARSPTSRATR